MATVGKSDRAMVCQLCEVFDIGDYETHEVIAAGNHQTLMVTTSQGKYFLKQGMDQEDLTLYSEVEQKLNRDGIRQARLFCTPTGGLLSSNGYAVFEHLDGEAPDVFTERQHDAVIEYLPAYNTALKQVQAPEYLTAWDNPWKKAASMDYLVNELPERMDYLVLDTHVQQTAVRIIASLKERQTLIQAAPHQLVHADLGPGNILFDGDDVVAIIDFTPAVAPELYALCQFFFWETIWHSDTSLNHQKIRNDLKRYRDIRQWHQIDMGLFSGLLIQATAFRLFGPLLSTFEENGRFGPNALRKRADLAMIVIDNIHTISGFEL